MEKKGERERFLISLFAFPFPLDLSTDSLFHLRGNILLPVLARSHALAVGKSTRLLTMEFRFMLHPPLINMRKL